MTPCRSLSIYAMVAVIDDSVARSTRHVRNTLLERTRPQESRPVGDGDAAQCADSSW